MNTRNVNDWVIKNLKNLKEGYVIRVENHKNDRWIEIRKENDSIILKEVGYTNRIANFSEKEFSSILNSIINYEFPRSNMLRVKVRMYKENEWKILGR